MDSPAMLSTPRHPGHSRDELTSCECLGLKSLVPESRILPRDTCSDNAILDLVRGAEDSCV